MSKKVKKTSSNILDKVRVLDEFKLPENQRKTIKEKAALASHILGRTMNASTIFDWIKKEAEYRRQAAGVYDGSSNKKPKNLRKPDTIAFGEELSKILDDYSKHTNITNQIMLDLARKLQEEKYPDLEKAPADYSPDVTIIEPEQTSETLTGTGLTQKLQSTTLGTK